MLSICLATVLCFQSQKVSIAVEPVSASIALEQLGQKLGTKMIPGGSVTQDIIAFRFRDTPTEVVLDRIAKGVNGEWQRDQAGILILTRTPAQEAAEKSKLTQATRAKIIKELAKVAVPPAKNLDEMTELLQSLAQQVQRSGDEYYQKAQEFENKLPGQRLLYRIMKLIPLEDIVNLPPDEKVSYSTNPTRRQRALPGSVNQLIAEFKNEMEVQRQVVEKLGLEDRFPNYYIPAFHENISTAKNFRVKLTLQRQQFGGISFQLILMSDTFTTHKMHYLNIGEMMGVSSDDKNHPLKVLAKDIATPVEWSPKASAIQKVVATKFGGRRGGETDEKPLVDLVTGMPAEEPVSVMVGPILTQLADAKDCDFVAVVPDMAFFIATQAGFSDENSGTLEAVAGMLASVLTVDQQDKFLVFAPEDPVTARESRFPRAATAQLAKVFASGRAPDFEQVATFVGSTDSDLQMQMSLFLASAVGPAGNDALNWISETGLLRLYGRLSNADRQKVKGEGLLINLNALPPNLVKPLEKIIFGDHQLSSSVQDHSLAPNRYGGGFYESPDGRETDPFVALGNGYPPNSAARLRMYSRNRIFARRSKAQYGSAQVFSEEDLGQNLAWEETPQWAQYSQARLDEFAVAQNRELFLDFDFRDRGMMQHTMSIPELSQETKWGPLESLPSEMVAKIKARFEEAKKSYQNMQFQSGGSGSKAP